MLHKNHRYHYFPISRSHPNGFGYGEQLAVKEPSKGEDKVSMVGRPTFSDDVVGSCNEVASLWIFPWPWKCL